MTTLTTTAAASGLRGLTARRPITVFLVLTGLLNALLAGYVLLVRYGRIAGPDLSPSAYLLLLVWAASLPPALWSAWASEGAAGVKALLQRTVRWRFPLLWWAFALAAMPLATAALLLAAGGAPRPLDAVALLSHAIPVLAVVASRNLVEELVWSGFVQTRLERRFNLFAAALLTALPFTIVHVPMLVTPGASAGSFQTALITLAFAALLSRLQACVVLRGARDSVLAVGVLHATWNDAYEPTGLAARLVAPPAGVPIAWCAAGAMIVLFVIALVMARGRLSRRAAAKA